MWDIPVSSGMFLNSLQGAIESNELAYHWEVFENQTRIVSIDIDDNFEIEPTTFQLTSSRCVIDTNSALKCWVKEDWVDDFSWWFPHCDAIRWEKGTARTAWRTKTSAQMPRDAFVMSADKCTGWVCQKWTRRCEIPHPAFSMIHIVSFSSYVMCFFVSTFFITCHSCLFFLNDFPFLEYCFNLDLQYLTTDGLLKVLKPHLKLSTSIRATD